MNLYFQLIISRIEYTLPLAFKKMWLQRLETNPPRIQQALSSLKCLPPRQKKKKDNVKESVLSKQEKYSVFWKVVGGSVEEAV